MHDHLIGPLWGNLIIMGRGRGHYRGLFRGDVLDADSSGRNRPASRQVRRFA